MKTMLNEVVFQHHSPSGFPFMFPQIPLMSFLVARGESLWMVSMKVPSVSTRMLTSRVVDLMYTEPMSSIFQLMEPEGEREKRNITI